MRKNCWEAIKNNITKHQISQPLKVYPLKSSRHHFKQNLSILHRERSPSSHKLQIMHISVRRRGRGPRAAASATGRLSHTRIPKRRSMKMMTISLWPLKKRTAREGNGARLETFRMSTSKKPRHLSLPMFQRYHLLLFETIINKWNYVFQGVYFVKGRVRESKHCSHELMLTNKSWISQLLSIFGYLSINWVNYDKRAGIKNLHKWRLLVNI